MSDQKSFYQSYQITSPVRPFEIHISDDALSDLRDRLGKARWPEQVGADWEYGTPVGYLKDLCGHWREGYDWRFWEKRLNAFQHFKVGFNDIDLHFIHQRSRHENAVPLLITHGWPGSIFEFHKIIEPLTDPERFGGSADDAFNVICPSIPGYGFSSPPTHPGFETRAASRLFMGLMDHLGYGRYFVQGGDLGAGISLKVGRLAQEKVAGIHLNMALVFAPKEDPMRGVSQEEIDRMEEMKDPDEGGYGRIQGTKPQTLGYGLHDSPVGLAAWIAEKFHGWTQHDGEHEKAVSRDEILTDISIYWFTATITSSARYYYECSHFDDAGVTEPPTIPAPVAFALFPGDLLHPPRAWAERQFNVSRWTVMDRGGHFAALEAPDLLVEDIRAAFRPFRRWKQS